MGGGGEGKVEGVSSERWMGAESSTMKLGVRVPQKGSPHPPLEEVLGKGSQCGQ